MLYRIANVNLTLDGFESEYIKHRLRKYEVDASASTPIDLRITFKENNSIVVPAGRDFRRLDAWYWIERDDGGYTAIKQVSQHRANFIRADIDKACQNVLIEYVDIKDRYEITTDQYLYIILGEIFAFCQTVRSATVLHSAAVSYKGQAVLFSAPSETGKSTHAGLWKKVFEDDVTLFNDDTPVIRVENDTLFACGTPWSGKTEINENFAYPLKGIVFLRQAKENEIRKLSTVEAVVKLLNETKKPVFEELMDKHMEFIQTIITKIPIYELGCTISDEAPKLVRDTLFKE